MCMTRPPGIRPEDRGKNLPPPKQPEYWDPPDRWIDPPFTIKPTPITEETGIVRPTEKIL